MGYNDEKKMVKKNCQKIEFAHAHDTVTTYDWLLLVVVVGCCWLLLVVVVGCCWLLLGYSQPRLLLSWYYRRMG